MLEHFKVPPEIAIRIPVEKLKQVTKAVFEKCGVPASEALQGAEVLMFADLKGIDTHGVSNMLRSYVSMYSSNEVNPDPQINIVKETAGTAVIDGDRGLGLMVTPKAMQIAINKARVTGVGIVSIRNSGHLGAAAYHAVMAAEQDMIGFCMTAGGKSMLPTFGATPQLGTNPIAFAAPSDKEPIFIFDAAMTAIAGNKIGLAQRLGRDMEPGWVGNADGTPNMEGGAASDFAVGSVRMQLPLGSTRDLGSHKGYGLGVMVEILCGHLSFAEGFASMEPDRRGHFVAAYNIEAFGEVSTFKNNMDGMLRSLRETKPIPGQKKVYYAGLPEWETEIERTRNGIPLHPEVVDWFKNITAELEIPFDLL